MREQLKKELMDCEAVIDIIDTLPANEACAILSLDTEDDLQDMRSDMKQEIECIRERIAGLEDDVCDWQTAGLDPAFSSYEEVNRMFA